MKTFKKHIIACTLIISGLTTSFAQDWEAVGQTMFYPDGETYHTAMALNESDEPYVVFNDANDGYKAVVMKYNGSDWVQVGSLPNNARYPSIAFNNNGEPYIAYTDWNNNDKATVMKFNGTDWETVGAEGFSTGGVYAPILAFSSSDEPYVVYSDWTIDNKVTVMKFDGNNWILVGTAGISQGSVESYTLAFSHNSEPYVAYSDLEDDYKVSVKRFNGTSWVNVGTVGFTDWGVWSLSMAFSNTGEPYVAFNEEANDYKASVMKFNGTDWVIVGAAGFSVGDAVKLSLAFSNNNEPHLSYADYEAWGDYRATVMKFDGIQWVNVGTPRFSDNEVRDTSLVFNSLGDAYIAYIENDGNSQSGPTVMKFSAPLSIHTPALIEQTILYPNPARDFVTITNLPDNATIKVIDILGKLVAIHSQLSNNTLGTETTIQLTGLKSGTYFIKIESPEFGITNKKLIINK